MKIYLILLFFLYFSSSIAETINLPDSWVAMPAKLPTIFSATHVVKKKPVNSINIFLLDASKKSVKNFKSRLQRRKLGRTPSGYMITSIMPVAKNTYKVEAKEERSKSYTTQIWKFNRDTAISIRVMNYKKLSSSIRNKLIEFLKQQ